MKYFILTCLPILMMCVTNATEIRVKNASQVDFKNVVVGTKKYGDIKHGDATKYQTWKTNAYRYNYVSLLADSKPLVCQPYDFVGEKPLGDGHFTYWLTVQNGRVEIIAVKDEK